MRNIIAILLIFSYSTAQLDNKKIISELKTEIDKFYKYQRLSSISFSIFISDSLEWNYQRGFSDINKKIQATENSIYPLASVTKPLTASLLLKYLSEKSIELEDSVYKILDYVPKDITYRELLTHSSGFKKLKNFGNYSFIEDLENINSVIPNRGSLKRKHKYRYHNINYAILSSVIENLSNNSFSDELKSYFNAVVNNNSLSFLHLANEFDSLKTKLYLKKGRRRYKHKSKQNALWQGAALAMTNSRDLSKFLKFHMTDKFIKIISEHKVLVRKRRLKNNSVYKEYYGAGFRLGYVNDKLKYIFHNGFIYGALAAMYYFTEENLGFVALSNMTPYPRLNYSFGSRFFRIISKSSKEKIPDDLENERLSEEEKYSKK